MYHYINTNMLLLLCYYKHNIIIIIILILLASLSLILLSESQPALRAQKSFQKLYWTPRWTLCFEEPPIPSSKERNRLKELMLEITYTETEKLPDTQDVIYRLYLSLYMYIYIYIYTYIYIYIYIHTCICTMT